MQPLTAVAASLLLGIHGLPAAHSSGLQQEATTPVQVQETDEPGAQAPVADDEEITFDAPSPRYPTVEDISLLFGAWDQAGGERVQSLDLGTSAGGRVVPVIQFCGEGVDVSTLADAPTVFLIGGADGRSMTGSLATLMTCHQLLTGAAPLGAGVCVIAIPMASPDGLSATYSALGFGGCDQRAVDNDADGQADEDGPDDLDGDGLLLEMLVEDPRGPWTLSSDPRFLIPAQAGDAPRYLRVPEGRDDDGDGRFNEDGAGGVMIDRNFPLDWRGPRVDPSSGSLPLDAPLARAIADLMAARRTAVVLILQGNHGGLRWYATDQAPGVRKRVGACYSGHCGRLPESPAVLAGEAGGSIGSWASVALDALALEIAAWGATPAPSIATPLPAIAPRVLGISREQGAPTASDQAWGRWLDDQRGGVGFKNWQQVELGPNRRALVGGWEPRNFYNPPDEMLESELAGVGAFVAKMISGMPQLEIRILAVEYKSGITRLSVQLANLGDLPTGQWETSTCRLQLVLPDGAELLAGSTESHLPCLVGGASSEPKDWLVRMPKGSALSILASSPWSAETRLEVR